MTAKPWAEKKLSIYASVEVVIGGCNITDSEVINLEAIPK